MAPDRTVQSLLQPLLPDRQGSAELSLAEIRDGLSEIEDMFTSWSDGYGVALSPSFNITGGEPLLRQDLPDVLAELNGGTMRPFF